MCADGGQYAAVFNADGEKGKVEITLSDLEIEGASSAEELWSGEKTLISDSFEVSLNSHGAKVYKIV